MTRTIILASSSPRRKKLLRATGIRFRAVQSGYEENGHRNLSARKRAAFFCKEKTRAVAKRYPNAIIIAADTLIKYKGMVLGKPHTARTAKKMLQQLSGQTHNVITSCIVLDAKTKKSITWTNVHHVRLRELTDKEIDAYIKTDEPFDKAGGYAIQGKTRPFITSYSGSIDGIIGLPIKKTFSALRALGVRLPKHRVD